jgi:hypothetical protein
LRGEDDVTISQCDPIEKNRDMLEDDKKWPISKIYPDRLKTEQKANDEAWPCGFIAKFLFSDIFNEIKSTDRSFSVKIDETEIAHEVDFKQRFLRNTEKYDDDNGMYWTDVEDQHLMVWYQMESLKDFNKLYGRVDGFMKAGKEYTITVYDYFASDLLDNEKHIVLSETGTFGGKNYVLAYFFGVASGLSLLVLIFFIIGYFMKVQGRRIEEESYIKDLSY